MPKKILLIEDNPDHALITKRAIETAGGDYQLDFVNDGGIGLEKAISQDYDLILCDYRLPRLNALDILTEMKKNNKDTPLVVVTSAGSEQIAVEVMKKGAYDYIIKDASYEDIVPLVIENSIERHDEKKAKEAAEQKLKEAYSRLKEIQGQLFQAEKLGAIGKLASGIAHEVKNPLQVILQGIDYLENKNISDDEDIVNILHAIRKNIKRANDIIYSLLDFSRTSELKINPEDINHILKECLALVSHAIKDRNIKIIMALGKVPEVAADKLRMEQVLINLLLNAAQAMPDGGTLSVRSSLTKLDKMRFRVGRRAGDDYFMPGENAVLVEIEDTGIGITEENLSKIFDPFFTTKPPGEGVGLGLSVTHNIMDLHRGIIEVQSEVNKGTKVSITLKIFKKET